MKKLFYLFGVVTMLSIVIVACQKQADQVNSQEDAVLKAKKGCETIQGGNILYSAGHYFEGDPLTTGFDDYGYNYQALKFQGSYFNSYAGGAGYPAWDGDDNAYLASNPEAANHWAWPYRDVSLIMKWNTDWISKTDCDSDTKLDRHWGFPTYIGSGAWLTNHQSGTYMEGDVECDWNYFVKIIAAPADAYVDGGFWYNADGTQIGPVIWGSFAIIQQVENDPCAGIGGLQFNSPDHSGLGGW